MVQWPMWMFPGGASVELCQCRKLRDTSSILSQGKILQKGMSHSDDCLPGEFHSQESGGLQSEFIKGSDTTETI